MNEERAQPFFEWLNRLSYFQIVQLLENAGRSDGWIRQFAPAFMTGVTYMDAASRRRCAVSIKRGKLSLGGVVLDTERMQLETVFSGIGWAIWVMSPRERLYTSSHVKGSLQHSSFLAGGDVAAAGTMTISRQNRLVSADNASGHYKPRREHMEQLQAELGDRGLHGALKEQGHTVTLTIAP